MCYKLGGEKEKDTSEFIFLRDIMPLHKLRNPFWVTTMFSLNLHSFTMFVKFIDWDIMIGKANFGYDRFISND
jgi:hypothetical protein